MWILPEDLLIPSLCLIGAQAGTQNLLVVIANLINR
jgi:hypothetical protein